jgi:hypothetical protein
VFNMDGVKAMSSILRTLAVLVEASMLAASRPATASVTAGEGGEAIPVQAPGEDQEREAPEMPPADVPPAAPPSAPPSADAAPAPPAPAEPPPADTPPGQWVYTGQYGWIWMPYSDVYTYVPPGGWGEPYAYVYGPAFGWTWVAAPWVWGFGPWPFFGVVGPVHFGWWGHGWWRSPWRWHFVPAPRQRPGFVRGPPAFGPGTRGVVPAPQIRPPPFRSAPPRPAPMRPAPPARWGGSGRR